MLWAKRQQKRRRQTPHGFTIIELLIVIVVIAILAAITIVAYNGITQKADTATLQSDLDGGYKTLGLYNATNGIFPGIQATAGLKSSAGVTLDYDSFGSAYCLQGIGFGQVYAVTSDNNVPTQGYCSLSGITPGTGNAYLNYPSGLVFDSSGNLDVADSDNSCIRQVASNSSFNDYAGICGGFGSSDGTGLAAQFALPGGITVNSSGILYVADTFNNCIRKISPGAVVTTVAGTCGISNSGTANGTGAAAQFTYPEDVAIDSSGNLYVTDTYNDCIRKIASSAVVTTFAGTCGASVGFSNGAGTAAQFALPMGLAFDSSGNLYVADSSNNCIRRITPGAVVSTFAGTCAIYSTAGTANGTGAAAQFRSPDGLAFDSSGNLYVADYANSCIREITPGAVVTTFAGTCGTVGSANGIGTAAQFNYPTDITFDSSGSLYVADSDNSCIRKITPSAVVTTYAGTCTGSAVE